VTKGVELIGIRVELVGIAMLLGCNLMLPVGMFVQPIGIAMLLGCDLVLPVGVFVLYRGALVLPVGVFVLYRGALVLLIRQILLSPGKIEAIGRLFQKSLGRFFQERFFQSAFGSR